MPIYYLSKHKRSLFFFVLAADSSSDMFEELYSSKDCFSDVRKPFNRSLKRFLKLLAGPVALLLERLSVFWRTSMENHVWKNKLGGYWDYVLNLFLFVRTVPNSVMHLCLRCVNGDIFFCSFHIRFKKASLCCRWVSENNWIGSLCCICLWAIRIFHCSYQVCALWAQFCIQQCF